jgi:DNA-binding XRE family transcriptional regulator
MFVILNIRGDYIGKKLIELLPSTMEILSAMGEQIKMARLRRNLSVELVAERANISRAALWNIENEVRPLLSVIM